jgi:hypothetical protein
MIRSDLTTLLGAISSAFLTLSSSVAAHAQSTAPLPPNGCYARDYPKRVDPENYEWIRLRIDNYEPRAGHEPSDREVTLKYAHWSLPHADFGYDGLYCKIEGAAISCSVQCDGGAITLRQLVNGDLLLEGDPSLRVEDGRVSSVILGSREADGFSFSGTHTLRPVPLQMCQARDLLADPARILFQVGDYHPLVMQVSVQLAKLGFLTVPPAPIYSHHTVAAMRAFQSSIGLEPTGITNARTLKLLRARATTTAGC